eukprot:439046-Pyramimonas_sp.AAC.1
MYVLAYALHHAYYTTSVAPRSLHRILCSTSLAPQRGLHVESADTLTDWGPRWQRSCCSKIPFSAPSAPSPLSPCLGFVPLSSQSARAGPAR